LRHDSQTFPVAFLRDFEVLVPSTQHIAVPNFGDADTAALPILESVPAVSAKLKEPVTADRKFEDVVKSAQDAAALVLVY
jgi:hypothetical protein